MQSVNRFDKDEIDFDLITFSHINWLACDRQGRLDYGTHLRPFLVPLRLWDADIAAVWIADLANVSGPSFDLRNRQIRLYQNCPDIGYSRSLSSIDAELIDGLENVYV